MDIQLEDVIEKTVCQLCAMPHFTKEHTCITCYKRGDKCVHTVLKCGNCKENHAVNDVTCSFYPKIDKKSSKAIIPVKEKRKLQVMDRVEISVPAKKRITQC